MGSISTVQTPAAVIDLVRMNRNIDRMQRRANALGVNFRPHVKTAKCTKIAMAEKAAGARGITVSTLKEAEHFFADGITDILYAVGMVPAKLERVWALIRKGCDLKIITDNTESAAAIAAFAREHHEVFEVLIEIDTDGHRSGVRPDGAALLDVARVLDAGNVRLGGVLTHAGASYQCDTPAALESIAEQERSGCVFAAERIRAAGMACPVVSVGSTPTALSAAHLDGVTEVRSGVYVFFDLVMSNVGVCTTDDMALSVLTTVIGHQNTTGSAIVDAGWMAMSCDRGTARQKRDYAYGQVCSIDGAVLPGYLLSAVNQEHGIVSHENVPDGGRRFPVGTRLRILPNHACATGAQFSDYHVLAKDGSVAVWNRVHGW
ncbi:MAG: alanine racemase [Steroidobacteraceae bacterium]|jgi:D-serine deaminase-like pyridoxal phosphate-dependent protein